MQRTRPVTLSPNGLSLVLATVGRVGEVARLFASIAQPGSTSIEVVVVDQNDDDRLLPVIEEAKGLGIDVLHLRIDRKGLSYARNVGLTQTRYELVGFPDDDCWYGFGVCDAVSLEFQSNGQFDGLVARWVERLDGNTQKLELDANQQRQFAGIPLASICLFFRRQLLVKLGGFDESLGVGEWFGAGEETDIVLRALAAGYRIGFFPEIEVHHHWSGTSIELSESIGAIYRRSKLRARGTGAMYAKHSLDLLVVARGLVAPLTKAVLSRNHFREGVYWLGTLVGRFQGFVVWMIRRPSGTNPSGLQDDGGTK
jgi:glycosyltransferase involved in cell wall biosynthesis